MKKLRQKSKKCMRTILIIIIIFESFVVSHSAIKEVSHYLISQHFHNFWKAIMSGKGPGRNFVVIFFLKKVKSMYNSIVLFISFTLFPTRGTLKLEMVYLSKTLTLLTNEMSKIRKIHLPKQTQTLNGPLSKFDISESYFLSFEKGNSCRSFDCSSRSWKTRIMFAVTTTKKIRIKWSTKTSTWSANTTEPMHFECNEALLWQDSEHEQKNTIFVRKWRQKSTMRFHLRNIERKRKRLIWL